MTAQLVVRRRQLPPRRAVLRPRDQLLPVLDARADGERLAHHLRAPVAHQLERVPRAVPARQDQPPAAQCLPLPVLLHDHARKAPVLQRNIRHPRPKAHLTAKRHDLFPQRLHHARQVVRADVRLGLIEYLLRRAVCRHRLQHPRAQRAGDARGQLAVGKRARAAFAELHVAARVKFPAPPEPLHVLPAPLHVVPPLQHDGPQPRPRQIKRRKQPRRPQPHHDRPLTAHRNARDLQPRLLRHDRRIPVLRARQYRRFVAFHGHIHRIHIQYVALVACIDRPLDNV